MLLNDLTNTQIDQKFVSFQTDNYCEHWSIQLLQCLGRITLSFISSRDYEEKLRREMAEKEELQQKEEEDKKWKEEEEEKKMDEKRRRVSNSVDRLPRGA